MKQNAALRVLALANGVFVLAAAMLAPLYAIFAEGIGADIFTIGLLSSCLFIANFLTLLVVRAYGDRIQEKEYLLLAGFLLRAAAWISFIFVESLLPLFFIQILLGIGEAVGSPAFNSIFAQHLDQKKEVEEYADWGIIATLTGAVGTFVGGLVVSQYGFDALFGIMALLAVISFFLVLRKPRDLL